MTMTTTKDHVSNKTKQEQTTKHAQGPGALLSLSSQAAVLGNHLDFKIILEASQIAAAWDQNATRVGSQEALNVSLGLFV